MRRLADGGVVHAQIATDGADDDLARVEAHADLDGHPVRAADPSAYCATDSCIAQRRVAGSNGVVLVGQRRAEERHDPVADDLVRPCPRRMRRARPIAWPPPGAADTAPTSTLVPSCTRLVRPSKVGQDGQRLEELLVAFDVVVLGPSVGIGRLKIAQDDISRGGPAAPSAACACSATASAACAASSHPARSSDPQRSPPANAR